MTINRKICPPGLKNNPNRNLTAINFITIHCTGNYNATAGALNHANYLFNGSNGAQVSWHYTVDGKEIWQSFEDRQACWHAGDGTNGAGNSTSIGVEICVNNRDAFRQACINTAWLVAELLNRHKLGIDKVVQHNRWSGKNCPNELRSSAWGVTWNDFIGMVREALAPPEITTVNDIVWQLAHRGILSDRELWLKKLEEDQNAYWLARKTVAFLRGKGV